MLELGRHEGLNSIAISKDGKHVASCSEDGWVRIWDIDESAHPKYERRTKPLNLLAFSPSSDAIALAGKDTVMIWTLETDRLRTMSGYEPPWYFNSLDFSSDGRYLVAGGGRWIYLSDENQGGTFLWDLAGGSDECVRKDSPIV